MTEYVQVVNIITYRARNSWLFSILCSEMGRQHDKLLHTKFRCRLLGTLLSRLHELRSIVQIFLSDSTSDFSICFTDVMWIFRMAYLEITFHRLRDVNKSLKGFRTGEISVRNKTNAFKTTCFHYRRSTKCTSFLFSFLNSFNSEN